jgi:hypothetical protein
LYPSSVTWHPVGRLLSNTAWIVNTEAVRIKDTGGKESQFTALATNVYEFQDGHWLMVVHQASLVP